jgi:uncharacterized protein (TIGR00369 family)
MPSDSEAADDSPAGIGGGQPTRFHEFADIGEVGAAIPLLRYLGVRSVPPSAPDVDVTLEMDRTDEVLNLVGHPHGGAITALIDHAGGLAVAVAAGRSGPTVDLHVRFLRVADGSPIRADARVLRTGRRLATVEVRVYGQSGKLAAIGTISTAPMAEGPPTED